MAAYLTSLIGGPDAFVLCYGADGHVALEMAAGDGCSDDSSHPEEPNVLDNHCGPCVDIPLSSNNSAAISVKKISAPVLASQMNEFVFQHDDFYVRESIFGKNILPTLSRLRTVVLRI